MLCYLNRWKQEGDRPIKRKKVFIYSVFLILNVWMRDEESCDNLSDLSDLIEKAKMRGGATNNNYQAMRL